MNLDSTYIFYGTKTSAIEVEKFILHILASNTASLSNGNKKTPICIWGKHGIGKTEMVEKIAKDNGYDFTYIAPAQFEEMGDLLGMPQIIDNETVLVPPAWVPQEDKPGILLIDDVNRADDRILRGIMQLLQNYELASWKLPSQWHIILTANPDGGDYSVTPMDDAMITRMQHITLEFDISAWISWAQQAGVDERGIDFVATYPEVVTGGRTTPRSLVQFFNSISTIKDLKKELSLVTMLADSCLNTVSTSAFISFVQNDLNKLISPSEVINTSNFKEEIQSVVEGLCNGEGRLDIVATLCTRLVLFMESFKEKPTKQQINNIQSFLKIEKVPNDIRLSMVGNLMKISSLKSLMVDPDLSKLLLQKM